MRKGTGRVVSGRCLLGVTLSLVLPALLMIPLSITACDTLTSGPSSDLGVAPSATTLPEGAAEPAAASAFGTWEGTYTPLSAWDRNGTVADPPVPLNVPVSLRLQLRPLSGSTGDYGTLTAGGFGAGRITALFFDGQNLELSVVSEAAGLDDLHSVITATIEGDVLTGDDSGDPNVPSGWVSTSGTLKLTRTSLSTAGETETISSGDTAGHSGGGEEDNGDGGGADGVATTANEPTTLRLGQDDRYHEFEIHVGDHVRVDLYPIADLRVEGASFSMGAPCFELVDHHQTRTARWLTGLWWELEAVAPGNITLYCAYWFAGSVSTRAWEVQMRVVE